MGKRRAKTQKRNDLATYILPVSCPMGSVDNTLIASLALLNWADESPCKSLADSVPDMRQELWYTSTLCHVGEELKKSKVKMNFVGY